VKRVVDEKQRFDRKSPLVQTRDFHRWTISFEPCPERGTVRKGC
jgi:hypothetical protein